MGLKVENINDFFMLIYFLDISLDIVDFQKKNLFLEMFFVLNFQFLMSLKIVYIGGNYYLFIIYIFIYFLFLKCCKGMYYI